jgi:hypothetical protein
MKLSKSEFKNMIKECIRELVNEGAFNEVLKENLIPSLIQSENTNVKKRIPSKELVQAKDPLKQAQMQSLARRMTGYDESIGMPSSISEETREYLNPSAPMNDNLKRLVETTAAQISKGDPNAANAYAAIFADTAMNTLPQQLANDPGSSGGFGSLAAATMQGAQEKVTEREMKSLAPTGDITRWAKLAFGK